MTKLYDILFGESKTKKSGAKFMSPYGRFKLLSRRNKGFTINGKKSGKIPLKKAYTHGLLVGSTGSGKTTSFIVPNLVFLDPESSAVIVDTGEAFELSQHYLKEQGFDVQFIDLDNPETPGSLQFNPLEFMESPADAQKVAKTLVDISYKNKGSDNFWALGAQEIIEMVIHRLCFSDQKSYDRNLQSVLCLIRQIEIMKNSGDDNSLEREELDDFFTENAPEAVTQQYMALMGAQANDTSAGLLASAKTALAPLNNPAVQKATHHSTINFSDLRDKPTVLFIIIREDTIHFNAYFLSLFFQALFKLLMNKGTNGKDLRPVFLFMDEAGIFRVEGLENIISVIRKKQVSVNLIIQSIQQLKSLYGENYKIILDNCLTKMVLGGLSSIETAQWLEKLMGEVETTKENGYTDKKPLMSVHQIRKMNNKVLCIHANEDPILLPSLPYFKNRSIKKKLKIK